MLGDFIDWLILELLKLKCNRYGLEIGLDANDRWLFILFLEAWCLIQANCYKDLALIYIYCVSWLKQNLLFLITAKAAHARTSNSFSDLVQELWNQGRLRKRALKTLVLLAVETTLFGLVSCFADDNVSAWQNPLLDFSQYCDHNNNNLSLPCRVVRPHGIFPN